MDMELFTELAKSHGAILTVEEGTLRGGFGQALMEGMESVRNGLRFRAMGIPDRFFEHGKREILLREAGLTSEAIAQAAVELLSRRSLYVR